MRARLAVSLAALALIGASTPVASAHNPNNWYPTRWQGDLNITWRFDRDFPYGGGIRQAVKRGAQAWNELDTPLRLVFQRGNHNGYSASRTCAGRSGIHWGPIDGAGGILARTYTCSIDGSLRSFQIKFDSDESWHRDPDSEPLPWQRDIFGIATHEFGHATGRIGGGDGDGHFEEDSDLCPDILVENRHTMCPSTSIRGSGYARTLETHDIDVFVHTYGR